MPPHQRHCAFEIGRELHACAEKRSCLLSISQAQPGRIFSHLAIFLLLNSVLSRRHFPLHCPPPFQCFPTEGALTDRQRRLAARGFFNRHRRDCPLSSLSPPPPQLSPRPQSLVGYSNFAETPFKGRANPVCIFFFTNKQECGRDLMLRFTIDLISRQE